ncbi:AraC family transcriptional regulator [Flavitalea flava]
MGKKKIIVEKEHTGSNEYLNNLVRAFLAYSVQRDLSPEYLCRLSGIDLAALQKNAAVKITGKQFNDLWINAEQLSGDSLLGLHFGESLQLAALGIVGQVIQSSTTVGDALTNAASLLGLLTDLFTMEVDLEKKTKIQIRFRSYPPQASRFPAAYRHMLDWCMVFVLHEMDGLLLKKLRPELIKMPIKIHPNPHELQRLLRISSIINSQDYLMVFSGEYRDLPVITANYELQQGLQKKMEKTSGRKGNSMQKRIENFIRTNAYLGIPSLDEIAANFNTSPRNLQRKLQEEGVNYQQLAISCRMDLAMYYLQSGEHRIKEISYILGYQELSAFSKAFKKWTGKSPLEYQKN